MDFELHVVRGRSASQTLKLADGVNTVGRHDACAVRIKSSQVSRKHCELFEKKGMLLVKDLGSANGTYVNGKKVDGQLVLEPGDELTIGGVKLRVAKVGQAPPTKAHPEAPKPAAGDTAVVDAIAVPDDSDDEEFEIDFDDEPAIVATGDHVRAAADAGGGDFLDAIEVDPGPAPAPKPAKTPEPAPSKAKATNQPAPPAKAEEAPVHEADEAIADFLLDIKLDDDE